MSVSNDLWALTENGTAAAETCLCSSCCVDRPFPRDNSVDYDSEDPVQVNGNDCIECTVCGWRDA